MMSLTSEVTILPKAPPMMIPTAMSITLPLRAKSLNSWMNFPIEFRYMLVKLIVISRKDSKNMSCVCALVA